MTAVEVSYSEDGPADAPVVVLSNSLGATRAMWDPQVPALAERYRVVTYDTRGHGDSPVPRGPYALDDLVDDVVALLDRIGAPRAHVAGLSLGGMTAMRLAAALADALTPSLGPGAAHDAAADAVRTARESGRLLPEVVAARDDVDAAAVLAAAAPDVGEAGAQVDAALAEHASLVEGEP